VDVETRLTCDYGVRHPIALAPMAFVGTPPSLAVAVCRAGGIGAVAAGPLPADAVRAIIRGVRAETWAPLNVNFVTPLAGEEQVRVCVEESVPIVSFHWGHPPAAFVRLLHAAGIKVWEQVGSAEAAREAVDNGADLIVAQGSEAGGHNFGGLPTFVLVPAVVDAVAPVPVLAAGGVATGRHLAAALMLGAEGVSVGTRFVASEEAFAHREYKRRLVTAIGTETRLTSVYGPDLPDFNPMRVLNTGLAREYAGREADAPKNLGTQPVIARMRLGGQDVPLHRFTSFVPTPDTEGDIAQLPFLSGQGVGFVRAVVPVQQIVEEMMAEAEAMLAKLGR
jgi:NAD(P)H-dependent flavin oxidoreductase YrpB (nitropropane dioxygenase family)